MPKKLFKINVYDDGHLEFNDGGKGEPRVVDESDMNGYDRKLISKDPHVLVYHANPTWVFIGGRWVRIG